MNTTIKNLINRRSCKAYKPTAIPQETIDLIIEAGLHAPSAFNRQSSIIIEVTDKDTINKLSAINARTDSLKRTDPYYGAPVVLLVLGDKQYPDYLFDGSLVAGNLLNAAYSLGLGACWINRGKAMFLDPDGQAFLKELGIEGDYEGICSIILGEPSVLPDKPLPRKANRVYYHSK